RSRNRGLGTQNQLSIYLDDCRRRYSTKSRSKKKCGQKPGLKINQRENGSVNMTTTDILTDMVLVESEKTATIHTPVERVDIADWLLHLPDAEYQRCAPPDHIAAGTTTTDDGRPMSINVEVIGGTLMVQHYVADVHEPHHCRMVSLSDVQTPAGW